MPFDFAQAEQMLNGSKRQTFALKVSLNTWRLCLQAKKKKQHTYVKTTDSFGQVIKFSDFSLIGSTFF